MLPCEERDERYLGGLEIRRAAEDAKSDGEMGDVAKGMCAASGRSERAGGDGEVWAEKIEGGLCEAFAFGERVGEAILAKRKGEAGGV